MQIMLALHNASSGAARHRHNLVKIKQRQKAHSFTSPTTTKITHQSAILIGTAQTQPYSGLVGLLRWVMRLSLAIVLRGPFRLLLVQSAGLCLA